MAICLAKTSDKFLFLLQRVIFNIVNFSKTKSLYRDGMAPMVKSTSRPKWYVTHVVRWSTSDQKMWLVDKFALCIAGVQLYCIWEIWIRAASRWLFPGLCILFFQNIRNLFPCLLEPTFGYEIRYSMMLGKVIVSFWFIVYLWEYT